MRLQEIRVAVQEFLTISALLFQLADEDGKFVVAEEGVVRSGDGFETVLGGVGEGAGEEVAVVAEAVAHEDLEFAHDGTAGQHGAVEQTRDDPGGLPVALPQSQWQPQRLQLHQTVEHFVLLVAEPTDGLLPAFTPLQHGLTRPALPGVFGGVFLAGEVAGGLAEDAAGLLEVEVHELAARGGLGQGLLVGQVVREGGVVASLLLFAPAPQHSI